MLCGAVWFAGPEFARVIIKFDFEEVSIHSHTKEETRYHEETASTQKVFAKYVCPY